MSLLQVENVSKHYAGHVALRDVSIDIKENSIFGLLGPNGAGKTSLIRIITQITGPDRGKVLFMGQPLQPAHVRNMGYLPEERGLYKRMNVGEQLLYLAQLKGVERHQALKDIKIWAEKFEISQWLNKQVSDLSKGMQQKVQFIATVLHKPSLIILDEPFSGFDPINANLLKQEVLALREQGATIIFSTHRMESVEELCDEIALINKAQVLVKGPVKSIIQQFSTNTYTITGNGPLLITSPDFVVENQQKFGNDFEAQVRLMPGIRPNDLLRYLLERVEINSFREKVPTMNDIFIQLVTDDKQKAAAQTELGTVGILS